jgi:hypothetical protein
MKKENSASFSQTKADEETIVSLKIALRRVALLSQAAHSDAQASIEFLDVSRVATTVFVG